MKRRPTTGAWVAGGSAVLVAAATIIILPMLPSAQQRQLGPLLLVAALACVFLARRQLRRLHRQQPTTGNASTSALAQQAVGGPCDGQHLALTDSALPTEIWLADESAPDHLRHHRYALERGSDGGLRYRYAPPD